MGTTTQIRGAVSKRDHCRLFGMKVGAGEGKNIGWY